MSIQSRLDALRQTLSDCQITAFGDVSSCLILRSSTDGPCPREALDKLGAQAASVAKHLDTVKAEAPAPTPLYGQAFATFNAEKTTVYARTGQNEDDVVCAALGPDSDIDAGLRAATSTILSLQDEGA